MNTKKTNLREYTNVDTGTKTAGAKADHFHTRFKERVLGLKALELPSNFYKLGEDKEKINSILLVDIIQQLRNKIQNYKLKETDPESHLYYATLVAQVKIKKDGKIFVPKLIVDEENQGTEYYAYSHGNILHTLILQDPSGFDEIKRGVVNHVNKNKEREDPLITIYDVRVKESLTSPDVIIDFEKVLAQSEITSDLKVTKNELDYSPRADYRIGATFDSKKLGKGTIVATSAGVKGIGDANGKLEWVDVDYGKPFVSGGKLQKYRRFTNIYTKAALKESTAPQLFKKYEIYFGNPNFYVSDKTINAFVLFLKKLDPGTLEIFQRGKLGGKRSITIKSQLTFLTIKELIKEFIQKYDHLKIEVVSKLWEGLTRKEKIYLVIKESFR